MKYCVMPEYSSEMVLYAEPSNVERFAHGFDNSTGISQSRVKPRSEFVPLTMIE